MADKWADVIFWKTLVFSSELVPVPAPPVLLEVDCVVSTSSWPPQPWTGMNPRVEASCTLDKNSIKFHWSDKKNKIPVENQHSGFLNIYCCFFSPGHAQNWHNVTTSRQKHEISCKLQRAHFIGNKCCREDFLHAKNDAAESSQNRMVIIIIIYFIIFFFFFLDLGVI